MGTDNGELSEQWSMIYCFIQTVCLMLPIPFNSQNVSYSEVSIPCLQLPTVAFPLPVA